MCSVFIFAEFDFLLVNLGGCQSGRYLNTGSPGGVKPPGPAPLIHHVGRCHKSQAAEAQRRIAPTAPATAAVSVMAVSSTAGQCYIQCLVALQPFSIVPVGPPPPHKLTSHQPASCTAAGHERRRAGFAGPVFCDTIQTPARRQPSTRRGRTRPASSGRPNMPAKKPIPTGRGTMPRGSQSYHMRAPRCSLDKAAPHERGTAEGQRFASTTFPVYRHA